MISILGEVTAGRHVALGPARQRCVLAALAVDVGRVVPVDRLIDRVWAPDVPPRARAVLQSYVSRLRQVLDGVDTARRHCRTALSVHRHHNFRDGEAATQDSLGHIEHHSGRHEPAIAYYEQALTLRRELGDRYESANTPDGLGHPYAALGQDAKARQAWQEALEPYQTQHRTTDAERVARHLAALAP